MAEVGMFERAVAFVAARWQRDGSDPWRCAERELMRHPVFGPWLAEVEDFDQRLDFAGYIVRRGAGEAGRLNPAPTPLLGARTPLRGCGVG